MANEPQAQDYALAATRDGGMPGPITAGGPPEQSNLSLLLSALQRLVRPIANPNSPELGPLPPEMDPNTVAGERAAALTQGLAKVPRGAVGEAQIPQVPDALRGWTLPANVANAPGATTVAGVPVSPASPVAAAPQALPATLAEWAGAQPDMQAMPPGDANAAMRGLGASVTRRLTGAAGEPFYTNKTDAELKAEAGQPGAGGGFVKGSAPSVASDVGYTAADVQRRELERARNDMLNRAAATGDQALRERALGLGQQALATEQAGQAIAAGVGAPTAREQFGEHMGMERAKLENELGKAFLMGPAAQQAAGQAHIATEQIRQAGATAMKHIEERWKAAGIDKDIMASVFKALPEALQALPKEQRVAAAEMVTSFVERAFGRASGRAGAGGSAVSEARSTQLTNTFKSKNNGAMPQRGQMYTAPGGERLVFDGKAWVPVG